MSKPEWQFNRKKLKQWRLDQGLSQSQVGKMLGNLSHQQVDQWENGPSKPNLASLCKICNQLGMSPADFFTYM